ncbi:MAG: ribonuclease Z [Candidatus Thorarchaeota archaeon]
MKVIFLGTSGSMPTQSRSSASLVIKRRGEVIMFDCGEGTQRRMVEAHVGFRRSMKIFISHLHGDHLLGLPGLIQTMTLLQREKELEIYGPIGLLDFIKAFSLVLGGPGFPVKIYEIKSHGIVRDEEEYQVIAVEADHMMPSYSYVLEEKPIPGVFYPDKAKELGVPEGPLWGKLQHGQNVTMKDGTKVKASDIVGPSRKGIKIAYSGDTKPTSVFAEASESSDLMIHEATFDNSLKEKADENYHSTAEQAAIIAKKAEVKQLVLTHISSRYPDASQLLIEAKRVFDKTIIAEDLMVLEVDRDGLSVIPVKN